MEELELKWENEAAIILGAPVGLDDQAVEDLATDTIQKYTTFFDRLLHDGMPEVVADQLLRRCGVPCTNYLTRVVAPSRMGTPTKIFDGWVEDTYTTKHYFSGNWDTDSSRHASLPLRDGGMGLRKQHDVRAFAFWGAAARACGRFNIDTSDGTAHPLMITQGSCYANQLREVWTYISETHPDALIPVGGRPPLLPPTGSYDAIVDYYSASASKCGFDVVPSLQSELTKLHYRRELGALKGAYCRKKHARVTACAAENATQWMIPTPVGEKEIRQKLSF